MSTTPRTPPSLLATTIVIIFTIHLIPLTSAAPSSPCPSWSYNQSLANGPQNWGSLCSEYASCRDGTQQSPVNLVDEAAEEVGNQLNNLHLNYRPLTNFTLISTRFTVEGTDFGSQKNTLTFLGLATYTLTEFHFHSPSEHRINGQQFALEIHYLHTDGKGNFATLALLYNSSEGGEGTSGFMQMMAILVPGVVQENSTIVPSIDISSQINITNGYYQYVGSTSTPPCTPGVQWFVAKDPILVDPGVLSSITSVLDNSRPLQPLNGRSPKLYTPGTTIMTNVEKWVVWILVVGLGCLGVLLALGIVRYVYRLQSAKRYENVQELAGFLGSTNNETL